MECLITIWCKESWEWVRDGKDEVQEGREVLGVSKPNEKEKERKKYKKVEKS